MRADLVIAQANISSAPGLDPAMVPTLQQLPELDAVVGAGIATMRLDGDTVQPMVMDTARIDAVIDMQVRRFAGDAARRRTRRAIRLRPGPRLDARHDRAGDVPRRHQLDLTVDALYDLKNLFGDLIVTTGGYARTPPSRPTSSS